MWKNWPGMQISRWFGQSKDISNAFVQNCSKKLTSYLPIQFHNQRRPDQLHWIIWLSLLNKPQIINVCIRSSILFEICFSVHVGVWYYISICKCKRAYIKSTKMESFDTKMSIVFEQSSLLVLCSGKTIILPIMLRRDTQRKVSKPASEIIFDAL